jgi:hypothetical protein|tara:strand:- start:87 stop:1298 length:1212 start_codon:yes stop_codon:yes gene_type:complete
VQNLFTNKTIAIGLEPEFVGVSPNQMNSFNTRSNLINGLSYKSDPSVGTEADLPVLADCQFTKDYMDRVYNQIQSQGGRVNVKCSTHIHLSTMPIKAGLSNEEFSRRSTEMRQADRNYLLDQNKLNQLFDTNTSSRIPLEVMKDILYRVSKHIDFFHSCFPKSRRDDGGFCRSANRPNGYWSRKPASVTQVLNARVTQHDLERVQNHTNGTRKYSAVNLQHYNTKKTVEFRSHGGTLETNKIFTCVNFLQNMVNHSLQTRFKAHTVQEELTSPSYIGRSSNTVKSRLWSFCRVAGGRSVQEIMDHCNINNAQSVRRTISEIRAEERYEPFIVTHNQQEYGIRYGTSNAYSNNGYEVLTSANIQRPSNNIEFISNNDERGSSELIASLDSQTIADLNERIASFR